MSQLKKLAGQAALYGISSILGRVLNYFLVPLYTGSLSLESNGIITGLYAWAAFINVLYTFGLETAYFRFVIRNKGADEEQIFKQHFSWVALISLVGTLVLLGAAWLGYSFAQYKGGNTLLLLLAVVMWVEALSALPMARLRFQNRPIRFVTIRMLTIGMVVGFNLLFLLVLPRWDGYPAVALWLGADMQPVIWVLLANLLGILPYLFIIPLRGLSLSKLGWQQSKPLLTYGFPIMLMGLAGMANELFGRVMLERLLPSNFYPGLTRLEALGIYGQCYKLSIFMTLVIQAFRLGAEPFFFKKSQDDDAAQTYAQVMDWFVLACCGILLAVSILLPWIAPYFLRRPEYFQGLGVVPILLLANIFLGVYYNLSVWFKVSDKPQMGTYITVGGAVFTILLNLILIPTIGYMGSAITTLGCYAGMAAACYLLGRKSYPVPYRIAPLLFLVTICGIGVAIMQMTSDQKLWFLLATALPLIWLWNAWQLYSRDRAEA